MEKKKSGVLLHVTSLFSPYGIGDLGPSTYEFIDFMSQTKQSFWQILPLNPIDSIHGNSPYNSIAAFAANPLLISPEFMDKDGFLMKEDIGPLLDFPKEKVDYPAVRLYKERILNLAYQRFKTNTNDSGYRTFCSYNSHWLEDFALFVALKFHFDGKVWSEWPLEIKNRNPEILRNMKTKLQERIDREKFFQYLFLKQWFLLKSYCNKKGIQIIGDIPIYVNFDSVDVWKNPKIFKLDEKKNPTFITGVPPDYFSKTGQLWGNPVYRWGALEESGYKWWIQRMEHALNLFDMVRIDHFRGLVSYWEIPTGEKTAINGHWVRVPAKDFFSTMLKHFPYFPIIAEDLGFITPDVKKIMRHFKFPGMKVLLFAFGEDNPNHPYLPHTYDRNCVVYTGTHDNNTIKGWIKKEATPEEKKRLFHYLGRNVPEGEVHWELIRLAMMSDAKISIFPMQDILGLDEYARMNKPAVTGGNWEWRLLPEQLTPSLSQKLLRMTEMCKRV